MPDQNPEVLKYQAEAALKRLDEARLHERCPKACKSCSQKHRKCQFKTGHYPKCDLCAKNNRECEIIPSPITHTRRTGDTGSPTSQSYAGSYGYANSPASEARNRSHRTQSGAYANGSPTGSPTDASLSGNSPSSYAHPPSNAFHHSSATTQMSSGTHGGAYSSSQNHYPQYAQYASGQGHNPGSTPHQVRDPSTYFVPSQTHVHPPSSGFVPSSTHWPENHGAQTQVTQAAIGQAYGYSTSTSTASTVRQASTPTVPQIHTSTGHAYVRPAPGYQVTSPASPGSSYAVDGGSMYHISPQNASSVRYGAAVSGQGYDQSLNSASSSSASENSMYYQQSMHQ